MGITGFSKWNKNEKLRWLAERWSADPNATVEVLQSFWHSNAAVQQIIDGFSENTLSNFVLPYGIAPNFLIDGREYVVPMVIEESSVVAAAASGAKFWQTRGGITTTIVDTLKLGQLHFHWTGDPQVLRAQLPQLEQHLRAETAALTRNMEARGGGWRNLELLDFNDQEPHYYQLRLGFETCDSMGANFINSVLEASGRALQQWAAQQASWPTDWRELSIVMAILSNYTPDCRVRATVRCAVEDLAGACQDMAGATFAERFRLAVRIAEIDPYRAVTHNKGIFNGIDAVVLATGNDFRAIEAGAHAYAARDGQYRSLSSCKIAGGDFEFRLELPLALGTVGGLTRLHPLAKLSLELLGQPSARELMAIAAATGLAQNFAAVRSLVTTGIQQGHMKMHLQNILHHLGATDHEVAAAQEHFSGQTVSYSAVRDFVDHWRAKADRPSATV